jgi:hypothetical protein
VRHAMRHAYLYLYVWLGRRIAQPRPLEARRRLSASASPHCHPRSALRTHSRTPPQTNATQVARDATFIDADLFFGMLFGSERFKPYLGTLFVASALSTLPIHRAHAYLICYTCGATHKHSPF